MTRKILALLLALALSVPAAALPNAIDPDPTRVMTVSAGTADQTSAELTLPTEFSGMLCILQVTAGTTLLLDLNMQARNSTGTWTTIAVDSPSAGGITGISTTFIGYYPSGSTAGTYSVKAVAIPRAFRMLVNHGNANAATYTLDCMGMN
jgi:hypothetical protein